MPFSIYSDIGRKLRILLNPRLFIASAEGFPLPLWNCVTAFWAKKNLRLIGLLGRQKLDIFISMDTMRECDRQTDGRMDRQRPTANTALTHSVTREKIECRVIGDMPIKI